MEIEIALLCSIIGLVLNLSVLRRNLKKDGTENGKQESDIEYIKRRTDDILLEQRNTSGTLGAHAERITRVEESVKQAHKRIDAISEREGE